MTAQAPICEAGERSRTRSRICKATASIGTQLSVLASRETVEQELGHPPTDVQRGRGAWHRAVSRAPAATYSKGATDTSGSADAASVIAITFVQCLVDAANEK